MDELKLLIEMVKELPSLALWVIAFFFAYKVIFVGSVYGLIRFAILKASETYRLRKENVDIRGTIDGMAITADGSHLALLAQLERLKGIHVPGGSLYIHNGDVRWLHEAIDQKLAKEKAEVKS